MMCGACEKRLCGALEREFGVTRVTASHTAGQAVMISETAPDAGKLASVISDTGFEMLSASSEPCG